jgi:hypothetical protein
MSTADLRFATVLAEHVTISCRGCKVSRSRDVVEWDGRLDLVGAAGARAVSSAG